MNGKLTGAVALAAALAAAAVVRPPRASPAFSFVTTGPLPTAAACDACHPERSERQRVKSRGRRRHGHSRRSKNHAKGHRRASPPRDVDLNRADAATLAHIPGISEGLARRIVAYRNLVGPFESLSDLDDLDGMSASRIDTLSRYLVLR